MIRPTRIKRTRAMPRVENLEGRLLLSLGLPDLEPPLENRADVPIILSVKPGVSSAQTQSIIKRAGGLVISQSSATPLLIAPGKSRSSADLMRRLNASPWIRSAELDSPLTLAETIPNDPFFVQQWGLMQPVNPDIDAPQAWDISQGAPSTRVAVIDSGIDYKHPDLYLNIALNHAEIPVSIRSQLVDTNADGQLDFYDLNSLNSSGGILLNTSGLPVNGWAAVDRNATGYIDAGDLLADPAWCNLQDDDANGYVDDLIGWNFYSNTNNPVDQNSHGTHVSGTIAALPNNRVGIAGVAWNTRIIPLRFTSPTGSGTSSNAIAAIKYASAYGADVINASWGSGSYSQTMEDAIQAAGAAGSVFVAAAGNQSADTDQSPFYPASYDLPNIIAVAAVNESGSLATFSNFGASTVDLAAPGQSIYSTIPGGYGYKSGTSMAAPHVAGVVALLAGKYPGLTPAQRISIIANATRKLPSLVGMTATGGLLNAYQALLAPPSQPPILAAPANLSALALSRSSIQLAWSGPPNAVQFKIERSLNLSTWFQIGQVSTSTTFTDNRLAPGTTYYYRVRATYPDGDSDYSNNASAQTKKR
jgi:subtilisin family serine protease